MTQAAIQDSLAREALYQRLRTARFSLTHPEVLEVLVVGRRIPESLKAIKTLCYRSKASCAEAIELQGLVESAVGKLDTLFNWHGKHRAVLDAIGQLALRGLKLFESDTLLTKLTSSSLGGSRDRVKDGHFERRRVFWLEAPAIDNFESSVMGLLEHGKLEPFAAEDFSSDSAPELGALQQILLSYGMGMARAQPGSAFLGIPDLWQVLSSQCEQLLTSSRIVTRLCKSGVLRDLTAALPLLTTLIREETNKDRDQISFATMFSTKPGIKELRDALDEVDL